MEEPRRPEPMVVSDVISDSLNTVGLPIPSKRRSNSLNHEKDAIETMAQMRTQYNRNDSVSGLNSQYSFCQQYSDVPPQPPPRRRSSTGGSKVKLEERLKPFHEERDDKVLEMNFLHTYCRRSRSHDIRWTDY